MLYLIFLGLALILGIELRLQKLQPKTARWCRVVLSILVLMLVGAICIPNFNKAW